MALVSVILLFMTLQVMTQQAVAQQMLNPSQAVTDPTKLESKNVADMQTFSIEKLYMTRQIGRVNVVAPRQADRVHLEHQRTQ